MSDLRARRGDIQVLRAVALISVLAFHAKENYFPWGFLGVDVFFVISGFVVMPLITEFASGLSIAGTPEFLARLKTFYIRRFFRLFPALAACLVVSMLLIFIFLIPSGHARTINLGITSLFLLGNLGAYRYSGGNYFQSDPNPLVHFWSLSAEEQIYILIPLILLGAMWAKVRFGIKWTIATIGFSCFAINYFLLWRPTLLANLGLTDIKGFLFFAPILRISEFALGAFISFPISNSRNSRTGARILLPIIVSLALALFLPQPGVIHSPLVVAVATASAIHFNIFNFLRGMVLRILIWVGDRSYSIYLYHMPLISIAKASPILGGANRTLQTCFALLLSIFLGGISYRFIEDRYRIRGSEALPNHFLLRAAGVVVLIPLLFLSVMKFGADNMYGELARNPVTSIAAWEMDKNCARITSSVPCIYPVNNSKGQIVLIGDSHAGALSEAFIEAAHSKGLTAVTMTMASCQFIQEETIKGSLLAKVRDVYSKVWPGNPRTCFQQNTEIINYLSAHRVDTVIVAQRSTAIEETVFATSFREEYYLKAIGRNLVSLRSLVHNVILVGPVPEFPDRQQLFGERLVWQGVYAPPKSFLRGKMLQDSFNDQLFYKLHTARWGIHYIDSISQFCTSSKCSRWDGANWLYFDPDHLGIEGAKLIEPLLVNMIGKVA